VSDELEVALDLGGETVHVGTAYVRTRRKVTTTDFTYSSDYLANRAAYAIDPALPLDTGRGFVEGLPGAFSDCAPDRWGRRLIEKRIRAEEGSRTPRFVDELDYLLGVSDLTRQGALRFRLRGEADYAEPSTDVPKVVHLPELLHASDRVARDDVDPADLSAIKILLGAGTGTLGGARPKASIVGDDGLLYIAKFPHPQDDWDVMAWEKTALDLAERAGIDVPSRQITRVDERTVLLLERFDRRDAARIGYISAMTLVRGRDGGGSGVHDYVELAAELADVSAATDDDLAALWRRVAFSVAVHNTDDHFRNHGLLRSAGGWRLSPVFDVNPNPDVAEERITGIGGATTRGEELEGLMANAADFGLSEREARSILAEVSDATRAWREVASANGAPAADIRRFEDAFEGLRDQMAERSAASGP
jgi:serine/threonine-protein kinase HipA